LSTPLIRFSDGFNAKKDLRADLAHSAKGIFDKVKKG